MKIAIVYDRVNKIGGAERVITALHKIWPEAPLYTAVYNPKTASWASVFKVRTSFLQKFPFAKTNHEIYPWLTPLAFESFNFDQFDVVISVTSSDAKGIITKAGTIHICYCLTPTRYLWPVNVGYKISAIFLPLITGLRIWDQIAAVRPDVFLSISKSVKEKIAKYYRRDSDVIYPPVDLEKWFPKNEKSSGEYFLVVSRLVSYKKIDIVIKAFNRLGLPLKIVGDGKERQPLRELANKNIEFLGQLSDRELLECYQNCKALVFPQEEDFGITPLEAQACGKPVIAFGKGGALETVVNGKTGLFFNDQTADGLIKAIEQFNNLPAGKAGLTIDPKNCRKQAEKFGQSLFKKKFEKTVIDIYNEFRNN